MTDHSISAAAFFRARRTLDDPGIVTMHTPFVGHLRLAVEHPALHLATAGTLLTRFERTAVTALSTGTRSRCSRATAVMVPSLNKVCSAPATMMKSPANINSSDQSISA